MEVAVTLNWPIILMRACRYGGKMMVPSAHFTEHMLMSSGISFFFLRAILVTINMKCQTQANK